jgi:hypothetical protein
MHALRLPALALLALVVVTPVFAAVPHPPATSPQTPTAQAPAPSSGAGAYQKPLFLAAYPICPSGYWTIDQSCQTCGTRPPFGGKSCTTCEDPGTGDQFTTCSQCDFINGCPQF